MLFNMINENTELNSGVSDLLCEASKEGFHFDNGGAERAVTELLRENAKLSILGEALEVQSTEKVLAGNMDLNEATLLQEGFASNTFEKIKGFLKKAWSRLLEVFNSFKLHILKLTNESKFITEAKKTLSKIKNLDVTLEGFTYTIDKVNAEGMIGAMTNYVSKEFSADGLTSASAITDKIKEAKSELNNGLVKASGISDDESDFNADLYKVLRNGEDSKGELKFNQSDCLKAVEGFNKAKNQLDKIQTAINKTFKSSISDVDKLKTEHDKTSKEDKGDAAKLSSAKGQALTAEASALATAQGICSKVISAQITALKDEKAQAKSLIMKAISGGRKKDREVEKEMNESVLDSIYNSASIL